MNRIFKDITMNETAEIVSGEFVDSSAHNADDYAMINDFGTIRIVARVPGASSVYEVLETLGASTIAMIDVARDVVRGLINGHVEEDSISAYTREFGPDWLWN